MDWEDFLNRLDEHAENRLEEMTVDGLIKYVTKRKSPLDGRETYTGERRYDNLSTYLDRIKSGLVPPKLGDFDVHDNFNEVDAESAYQRICQALKDEKMDNVVQDGKLIEIINKLVASNEVENRQLAANGRFL